MLGMVNKSKITYLALLIGLAPMFSSCIPAAIVGGAGAIGFTAAQERSLGSAIDDASIEAKINTIFLSEEDKELFFDVDVDSVEGRVLLTGTVPTRQARIRAYKIAWRPGGVREVINEIKVDKNAEFSTIDTANDIWISTKVESKLLFAKDVASINYSVETIDGVVYMMGVAKDREELKKAAEIAASVSGVKKVISHVRLKDSIYRKQQISADEAKQTIDPDSEEF
jgi:osmotically-inducible protein OsmY